MTPEPTDRIEAGYDAFYRAWGRSPTLRRIWREHACGRDFPETYEHISFLSLATLGALADGLAVAPGDVVVDLACGAGGPGLWVAGRAGVSLVGVDLSAVAVSVASERAAAMGVRASFRQGTFADTGLEDELAAAVMSVDALQYAPSKAAALAEVARVLRPGGRLAFLAFELDVAKVAGLGVWEDPVGDYRPLLEQAGFTLVSYDEVDGWRTSVTGAYAAVLAEKDALVAELGPDAAGALEVEAAITLQLEPYSGHVLAVAERLYDHRSSRV